ncbi:MAG: hypothetical protein LLG00_00535 [Planctomycetaceae bacterium]|nr:hypothetical protein [Planctomycetaceae bacterium]
MNEDKSKLPITLNVLQTMASVPGAVVEEYWKRRVFEPFVLLLHAKREPIDLPEDLVQRDLGPYAGVLECWDWPERVPAAIAEVCDYHCEKMFERRNDWGPEFIDAPFDLVPVEVLAIFAVRRCLGLPPVTVNHPLLETPLANVVPDPTFDIDDTLRYVENVYSDVFGGT